MNFYMLIGIVGSGKSTYGKKFAAEIGATYISSDDIRQELTGNITDQSKNGVIFSRVIPDRITAGLSSGDVVYDATNYNMKARKDLLALAKGLGAKTIAIVIDTPFDECRRRNSARTERVVPSFVLDRMIAGYQAPDKNIERIDEIKTVTV